MRRPLLVGLAISAAVHALVLLFLRQVILMPVPVPGARPDADAVPRPRGMQVYNLAIDASAPPIRPTAPTQETRPAPSRRPAAEPAAEPEEETAEQRAVDERLRPRLGDARIWAPVQAPPVPEDSLTTQDAETRIARQLGIFNDSAAAAAERARRATDWTVTDANGGRWGISPGKLHLGKLTLPLPLALPPPSGPVGQRMAEWEEIQGQAARERARESFEDRVRAIRERKDREREEQKQKEPPPPPPSRLPGDER